MRLAGTKWICDRCGKEEFTRKAVEHLPNGRTIDDTPMPEGWGRMSNHEQNELCKECFEKYQRMEAEFFGKKR